MTLHQLKTFLGVANFGRFTRAAAELRMSRPDVSLQIRNLEREMGLALFERLGKQIRLTEAGEILKDCANVILFQLRETEQVLAELKGSSEAL